MNFISKKLFLALTSILILINNKAYADEEFNLRVRFVVGTSFLAKVCHPYCSGILGVGSSVDLSVKLGEIICLQIKGLLWDHEFYFKLMDKKPTEILAWGTTFHPQLKYSPELVKIFDENNLNTDTTCRKYLYNEVYSIPPFVSYH